LPAAVGEGNFDEIQRDENPVFVAGAISATTGVTGVLAELNTGEGYFTAGRDILRYRSLLKLEIISAQLRHSILPVYSKLRRK
jgi:hypothetical protein